MSRNSLRWMCILASLWCLAAHPSMRAQQPSDKVIVIRGSDTLGAKLIPQWAEGFRKAGAKVSFDIAAEGSTTAFTNLADKTCRIGMSSRRVTPEETEMLKKAGVQVQEIEVARDQIVIALNAENPISALSKEQVEKLFTGDILNWSELGGDDVPVRIATRNSSSGAYKDFKVLAMNGRDYGANRILDTDPPSLQVAGQRGGIAYLGFAYAKAKGIKVVPIDGVQPGRAGGAPPYPYERAAYLYVSLEATPIEREFLEFIKTPLGNKISEVVGFFPPVTKK
ncbi:PstS family phosphate ABC transporter substrate-binding protein [Roseimicrobium gellanilyticum]|nr:PstS family phosphate ABC transporter substrate-binding protein [Roseimicrobium gellanilyticum]